MSSIGLSLTEIWLVKQQQPQTPISECRLHCYGCCSYVIVKKVKQCNKNCVSVLQNRKKLLFAHLMIKNVKSKDLLLRLRCTFALEESHVKYFSPLLFDCLTENLETWVFSTVLIKSHNFANVKPIMTRF